MNIVIKEKNINKSEVVKIFNIGSITTTLQDLLDNTKIIIEKDQAVILRLNNGICYLLPLNYDDMSIYGFGQNIVENDLILLSNNNLTLNDVIVNNNIVTDSSIDFINEGITTSINLNGNIITNYISGGDDIVTTYIPSNHQFIFENLTTGFTKNVQLVSRSDFTNNHTIVFPDESGLLATQEWVLAQLALL